MHTVAGERDLDRHKDSVQLEANAYECAVLLPIVVHMARWRLRVLVYPETGRRWTARALEHDIACEGRTIEAAVDSLAKIARAHIAFDHRHNRIPLSAFVAAPQIYWSAFEGGKQLPPTADLSSPECGTSLQIVAAVVERRPGIVERRPGIYDRVPIGRSA